MSGSIESWSTTATDNDSADGDIDWKEGQNAKTVNNSARQMMGRTKEWLNDMGGLGTVGGTANAITLTLNSSYTTLVSGLKCVLKPTANNTASATLNVNGIGAKVFRKFDATGEVPLAAGDLQAGNFYHLIYSSSANSSAGAWICLNPVYPAKAADSAKLNGKADTAFATAAQGAKADAALPATSQAADSDKLDGQHGSYYRDLGNATGTLSDSRLPSLMGAKGIGVPSDFWTSGVGFLSASSGWIGTNGAFETTICNNGYRNSSSAWTCMGNNGSTSAAMIALRNDGSINFRQSANWPTGSGTNPPTTFTISPSGDVTTVGDIEAGGSVTSTQVFASSTSAVVLAGTGGGVYLRPNGSGSSSNQTFVSTNGNMTVAGSMTASGDITYSSDIALKDNIAPIEGALERVRKLGGYLYDRIDTGAHSAGLIAQEVEKVLPEAVHTDAKGMKAIAAGPLIGLLVAAIKELAAK